MPTVKPLLVSMVIGLVKNLIPRPVRSRLIQLLLRSELDALPQESLRRLLAWHDETLRLIDVECLRWGEGVHVKHRIMTGIHSFFYENIPPGSNVLDIGCGVGAIAHAIASHVDVNIWAIDINPAAIDFARRRFAHPRIKFLVGDILSDPIPISRVDVVVLSSILEHLPDRITFLKELQSRWLPSIFLIRVPTLERSFIAALKHELGLFAYTDPTHQIEYTLETFTSEMEAAGLAILHSHIRWGDIWAVCSLAAQINPMPGSAPPSQRKQA